MADTDDVADVVISAIADGTAVDWRILGLDRQGSAADALLRELRIVEAQGAERRPPVHARVVGRLSGLGLALLGSIAGLKVGLAVLGAATHTHSPLRGIPSLAFQLAPGVFGTAALALYVAGAAQSNARRLAMLFVLIAAAFGNPMLPVLSDGAIGATARALIPVTVDAFLALALWRFVAAFPTPSRTAREASIARLGVLTSGATGLVLAIANGWLLSGLQPQPSIVQLLDRRHPELAYWPLLFSVACGAMPYLLWRARRQEPATRQRLAWFVVAIVVGLTPFLIAVVAAPVVPALSRPPLRDIVGTALYAALFSIVPMTAYSVVVRKVVDVRLMFQRTARHAGARTVVWLCSLGPLALLVWQAYEHRNLSLAALASRPGFGFAVAVGVAGLVVATFRDRLLVAADRWFLAEPIDVHEILSRLDLRCSTLRSTRELAVALHFELEVSMRPEALAILLPSRELSGYAALAGRAPHLDGSSRLVALLREPPGILRFDDPDGRAATLLPGDDRQWLAGAAAHVLTAISTSQGQFYGLVMVGANRSGLSWSRRDVLGLRTVSRHFATTLDNHLVRTSLTARNGDMAGAFDWSQEPAVQCIACQRVLPAQTQHCSCGGSTTATPVPHVIAGKFRVERFIGAGGMGVVYSAIDIQLDRLVAVKILAVRDTGAAGRLQREARAMAAVHHPNLAVIYGVEVWRDTPMLVVEHLSGGTLADRLRIGPLSPIDATHLGVFMADALERVHLAGLLHRDIKPSNIGYTADGIPKLLDFGLAIAMPAERPPSSPLPLDASTVIAPASWIRGTPLYLSPESAEGAPPTPSIDLWSLSMTLLESVSGRHPFAGLSADDVLERLRGRVPVDVGTHYPDCPPVVRAFFDRTLSAAIVARPTSAAELRALLQQLRGQLN